MLNPDHHGGSGEDVELTLTCDNHHQKLSMMTSDRIRPDHAERLLLECAERNGWKLGPDLSVVRCPLCNDEETWLANQNDLTRN